MDFLTARPQAVRVGSSTSSTIVLNTGAPQGCVLSPLLFTLLTHDCTQDESNYRSEVSRLAKWCGDNNLSLNVEKTKEIVQNLSIQIGSLLLTPTASAKSLGVWIDDKLSLNHHVAGISRSCRFTLQHSQGSAFSLTGYAAPRPGNGHLQTRLL
uniref:Reverse transcriptase domain-containing protein n=1 Tax=Denticeps clupeoides TaxID=299321 RepID=A0AAY4A5V6_9TELE